MSNIKSHKQHAIFFIINVKMILDNCYFMLKTHLRNLSSGDCAYRRNNSGIKKCFILNIFDGIFQSFIQIAVF